MRSVSKLERSIRALLEKTNLPFTIEDGTKHNKVYINGKFIGVFSKGLNTKNKDEKAFISKINRAIKEGF